METPTRQDVINVLVRLLADRKLDVSQVLPSLKSLSDAALPAVSLSDLQRLLDQTDDAVLDPVRSILRLKLATEALRFRNLKLKRQPIPDDLLKDLGGLPGDAPIGWITREASVTQLGRALSHLRDLRCLADLKSPAPLITQTIEDAFNAAARATAEQPSVWASVKAADLVHTILSDTQLEEQDRNALLLLKEIIGARERAQRERATKAVHEDPLREQPAGVDEELFLEALASRALAAESLEERQRLLDRVATWPTDSAAPVLPKICNSAWAQDRANLILTLRFGEPHINDWSKWIGYLENQQREFEQKIRALGDPVQKHPADLLLLWCTSHGVLDAGIGQVLEKLGRKAYAPVDPENLAARWHEVLTPQEANLLVKHLPPPLPQPVAPPAVPPPPPTPTPPQAPAPEPPRPAMTGPFRETESASSGPPLSHEPTWQPRIRLFFLENWYLVVGLLMMLVGCSVLVYYTWDKSWLLRNTLTPALLAAITLGLAKLGSMLDRIKDRLPGTSAVLRAAAIGLLPVNLMLATRLMDDPQMPAPAILVPLVFLVYVALIGLALNRWTASVHPPLARWLGVPLLLMNLLVLLRPAIALSGVANGTVHLVLEFGFYTGFFFAAIPLWFYTRHKDLMPAGDEDHRVLWFFWGTLILTFLESMGWVYGSMHVLPRPFAFSPMIVLTAGLFLDAESRIRQAEGEPGTFGRESFIGFALLFAGVMMSLDQPPMRVFVMALTAAVWLAHAWPKAHPAHDTLGLVLVSAACVAPASLPAYPVRWLPLTGLAVAAVMEIFVRLGRRLSRPGFDRTASAFQVAGLAAAFVITVYRRWVLQTDGLLGAGFLVAAAAAFVYLAHRDRAPRWIYTSIVLLALAIAALELPHPQSSISLALALACWLWTWIAARFRLPIAILTRVTVPLVSAAFTLAVLLFQVADYMLHSRMVSSATYLMTLAGPVLMILALVPAARRARSPLPSWLAALIFILLCSLRWPSPQGLLSLTRPGSGLISSILALPLVLACFRIRRVEYAPPAEAGSLFFGGGPFPFQCDDHRLFTHPLLGISLFLLVRTALWTIPVNMLSGAYALQTTLGFGLTAVTWTGIGTYLRGSPARAAACIHAGWVSLLLALLAHEFEFSKNPDWAIPVLVTFLTLQATELLAVYLGRFNAWIRELMADAARRVLRTGGLAITVGCLADLSQDAASTPLLLLMIFVGALHVRHGLAATHSLHGIALFLLCWVNALAQVAPGEGPLLQRLGADGATVASLLVVIAAHAAGLFLERSRWKDRARALIVPPLVLASGLSMILAALHVLGLTDPYALSRAQQIALFASLLLAARALRIGPALLLAAATAYLMALEGLPAGELLSLRNLSMMSLAMVLTAALGERLHDRAPAVFSGGYAPATTWGSPAAWLYGPAVFVVAVSVPTAVLGPLFGFTRPDAWTPFIRAAALIIAARTWRLPGCLSFGVTTILLGNIQALHVLAGPWLRDHGLTWLHVTNIGLLIGLAELAAARALSRSDRVASYVNRMSLIVSGSILTLILFAYFASPDLRTLTTVRLAVSAVLAYAAALGFRQVARRRPDGLEAGWIESFHHFGVTLALWCTALMWPPLRTPGAALWVLALPLFYFYSRVEFGAPDSPFRKTYLVSASVMGFLVLALYVFRFAFQLVLFPAEPVTTLYYHHHAPLLIVIAPLLLRLRALGGTPWLACYGGLAMIVGSYFTWTAWPGLSPFTHPIPAAWCAFAVAQFWILLSYQRSPIRSFILRFSALDVREWYNHRHTWGLFLLIGAHAALIRGVAAALRYNQALSIAPLTLAAATLFMHMAFIRRSTTYYVLGWIEIALALHMDFLVPSPLPARFIGWAILGIWAVVLAGRIPLAALVPAMHVKRLAQYFGAFALAHVFYLGPSSTPGLWIFGIAGVLAAFTPVETREPRSVAGIWLAAALPWIPTWLVFFSQVAWRHAPLRGTPTNWGILTTTLTVLLTGLAAGLAARRPEKIGRFSSARAQPLLADRTLGWLAEHGDGMSLFALILATAVITPAWLLARVVRFEVRHDMLLAVLCAMSAAGWFFRSWTRRSVSCAVLGQLSAIGAVAALRAAAMLMLLGKWTTPCDIVLSLVVSTLFTLAHQMLYGRHRELERAFTVALLVLPAAILGWAVRADWGFDPAILIVSVHTLLWIWAGKDERESPFNGLAIGGFAAVLMMIFWKHFSFHMLHAYVIPSGLGVLALLRLYRDRVDPAARNVIRACAMVAMMGSVAYELLTASSHTFAFHITFLLLSLLAMTLGGWLNVRIYLLLGFGGVLVDLVAIGYQAFLHMDRSFQMTLTGLAVLLLGAAFVFGSVYFKTHHAALTDKADSWKRRFRDWE